MRERRQVLMILTGVIAIVLAFILLIPQGSLMRLVAPIRVERYEESAPSRASPSVSSQADRLLVPNSPAKGGVAKVVVSALSGEPVDGAMVSGANVSSGFPLPVEIRESEQGVFRLGLSTDGETCLLAVEARGFATYRKYLDLRFGDECKVELAPSRAIRGRAVTESGAPAPSGLAVYACAIRQHRFSLAQRIQHSLSGLPSLASATTEEGGFFEISGLDRNGTYALICGGRGWICRRSNHRVAPEHTEPVTLTVWRGYACVLTFVSDFGVDIPAHLTPRLTYAAEPFGNKSYVVAAGANSWEGDLLQYGCDWDFVYQDWRRQMFLVAAADPNLPAQRFESEIEVAGFVDTRCEIELAPVVPEFMTESQVTLSQRASGFGQVEASFDISYQLSTAPGEVWRPAIMWVLQSVDDPGLRFEYAVDRPSKGPVVARGLPWGRYSSSLGANRGSWAPDPDAVRFVDVGQEPSKLRFDARRSGCLHVSITNRNLPPGGSLEAFLVREDGSGVNAIFFSPPYVVECAEPGRFILVIRKHFRDRDDVECRVDDVTIVAGQVTRQSVELVLE
jgi:hypothetical protein